mgnify:CR=1 FL=1
MKKKAKRVKTTTRVYKPGSKKYKEQVFSMTTATTYFPYMHGFVTKRDYTRDYTFDWIFIILGPSGSGKSSTINTFLKESG